jgi:hypothetical protein
MHRMEQLALAAGITLEGDGARVLLDGEDITEAIRGPEVSKAASLVATIPGVRRALVEKQRAIGAQNNVVMEGRDIGSVVFPSADLKIFLDADVQERARRRAMEVNGDCDVISRQIRERDERDRTRAEAPLPGTRRCLRGFDRPLDRRGRRSHPAPGARPYLERKGVSLKDLLVMKFGGTSVGSADRMRAAARLSAEQRHKRPVVIVVSAMSGITDLLIETTKHAEAGDRAGLDANMRKLEERHTEACGALLPGVKRKPVLAGIRELVKEFERITHGMLMLGDRPPRSVDEAIAIGERLSALMMAACLNASGTKAEAVNAAGLIVTDAVFGSASPLMNQTTEKTRKRLGPLLQGGVLPVVTGFNGATADGRPTTLGRGGSDFSASILSAALGALSCGSGPMSMAS